METPWQTKLMIALNDALQRRDLEAVMALMTPDCVFENTWPPPDGSRYEGQKAVRDFWQSFLAGSVQVEFEVEDAIACGDRGVLRWRYRWTDLQGVQGHVRGVDIFSFKEGKICAKLSYVKG